jgi:hypothetical protein
MKTRLKKGARQLDTRSANSYQRRQSSAAEFVDKRGSSAMQNRAMQGIDNSPAMTLQRKQLEGSIGDPVQKVEEDELMQGKFNTMQRMEEDELQGKFETLQRREVLEEEELLQGKFESVQLQEMEEEEMLQGKFDSVQRVSLEEDELQGKFETLQRMADEEEELLQGKFSEPVQREQESTAATNQTGMPDNLKSGIESLSGMDVSDVRVHYNSSKPAQLNALAYAQGSDIHLGSGQEKHLPHEAWHTVQQREGRVKPTMQMAGEQINDDAALEKEADVMGAKALHYKK